MPDLLEKIKGRIAEKDSPIRTVKGVVQAIGMSEGGFYRMVERDSTKYGTLLAISKALAVDESYFTGESNNKETTKSHFESDAVSAIINEMQLLREQLSVKDQQIAGLQRTLEILVGKSEGAIFQPIFDQAEYFEFMMHIYKATGSSRVQEMLQSSNVLVANVVAPS